MDSLALLLHNRAENEKAILNERSLLLNNGGPYMSCRCMEAAEEEEVSLEREKLSTSYSR